MNYFELYLKYIIILRSIFNFYKKLLSYYKFLNYLNIFARKIIV